jgi:hypothetical protein
MPDDTPALDAPRDGYVFIVTYGRSGSTLLQLVLNSIPGYCIRGENANALFRLAQAWAAIETAEPMRGARIAGEATGPDHPWFGAERADPDRLGRGLAEVFVRETLSLPGGTRVGGFKEIRFHLAGGEVESYLDFITRFFPNPRFVFNTRSHQATARSGWWARMDPAAVKAELTSAERVFARMQKRLGNRAIALHYDDYAQDPEALRPLFDFLGEPFDAAQVAALTARRLSHTGVA